MSLAWNSPIIARLWTFSKFSISNVYTVPTYTLSDRKMKYVFSPIISVLLIATLKAGHQSTVYVMNNYQQLMISLNICFLSIFLIDSSHCYLLKYLSMYYTWKQSGVTEHVEKALGITCPADVDRRDQL